MSSRPTVELPSTPLASRSTDYNDQGDTPLLTVDTNATPRVSFSPPPRKRRREAEEEGELLGSLNHEPNEDGRVSDEIEESEEYDDDGGGGDNNKEEGSRSMSSSSPPPSKRARAHSTQDGDGNNHDSTTTEIALAEPAPTTSTTTSTTTTAAAAASSSSSSATAAIKRTTTMMLDKRDALKTMNVKAQDHTGLSRLRRMATAPVALPAIPCRYPAALLVIRHGESAQNVALDLMEHGGDTLSGVRDADIPLTDVGRAQAVATGNYIAEHCETFDICFVSPYIRAVDTANIIVKQLPYHLDVFKDNRLREKEFGRFHGMRGQDIKEKWPLEFDLRQRDGPYWYRFPNGENYPDVEARMQSFLDSLADYAGRRVLVVTHQVPYKMLRAVLHHLGEEEVIALEAVHNCGMQEWELSTAKRPEGRLRLKHFNLTAYAVTDRMVATATTH